MPKSLSFEINPELLEWARASSGLTIAEVAKRLHRGPSEVEALEKEKQQLSLTLLERLALIYKRPLAVFFLPTKPIEPPLPTDFRTLPKEQREPLSPPTQLAIRKARWLQSVAIRLKSEGRASSHSLSNLRGSDPEKLADQVREKLGVSIQVQAKWDTVYEALRAWRHSVEAQGLLVFQETMPLRECRGFSITDKNTPVIVLNSKDHPHARIFSLFHELAHVVTGSDGICDMRENQYEPKIEIFCNHFSGAFLVPKTHLANHELVHNNKSGWPDERLLRIANHFKVSKEVILRRLLIFEYINEDFYQRRKKEWELSRPPEPPKRKNFKRNMVMECISEKGPTYINLVIEKHHQGTINTADLSDFLGIKLRHLKKLQETLAVRKKM